MYNSEVLNIWQWRNYISDLAGELTFGPQHWIPLPPQFQIYFSNICGAKTLPSAVVAPLPVGKFTCHSVLNIRFLSYVPTCICCTVQ